MGTVFEDEFWLSALCLGTEVSAAELHTTLLDIVRGLRAPRRDVKSKVRFGEVERKIGKIRDLAAECLLEPDIATSEQDMITMYSLFVSLNGWQRHFVVPQVLMVERTALEDVAYDIPELREFSIDAKVTSLAVKLPALEEGGTKEIAIQDLIDGLSEHTGVIGVPADSWDDLVRLALKGPEIAQRVTGVLHESIDWILKRTVVERDAFRWPGGTPAPSITNINTSRLRKIEDPILLIDEMKDLYRRTIGAVRTGWTQRKLRVKVRVYDAMREATEDGMPKLLEASVSRQYLADEPRSGVVVFTAQALTNVNLIMPENRVLRVPFGMPGGRQRREKYQVFGVGVFASEHYTGYFWREGRMFRYNDLSAEPLVEVTSTSDLQLAAKRIAENGLMFFSEKFWEPPAPAGEGEPAALPQATPVQGITDAGDWEVWSQLAGPDGPYTTVDDVVADLQRVLPKSGSNIELEDLVILTREDISSVFPAQFMTGFVLDRYGALLASRNDAFFVTTSDVSQIITELATGIKVWDEQQAVEQLGLVDRLLFPINNIKILGTGDDAFVDVGDHWSLLVLEVRNGGVVSARHYDSKHQNNDHAQAVVGALRDNYALVPRDIVLENVEACVLQPKTAPPRDPRASACAPIVLGYIRALAEAPTNLQRTALSDDEEWRTFIIDDILAHLKAGTLRYPAKDETERGEKRAIFLRLFTAFRSTMDDVYW
jgi:hypothetical protein